MKIVTSKLTNQILHVTNLQYEYTVFKIYAQIKDGKVVSTF